MKENKRAEQDLLKGNVLNLSSCILDPVVHQAINSTMKLTVQDHRVIQDGRNLKRFLVQPPSQQAHLRA